MAFYSNYGDWVYSISSSFVDSASGCDVVSDGHSAFSEKVMGEVLSAEKLKQRLEESRNCDKKVFTNGCFDILHVGHIRYLQEARSLGDLLIIGLNSDSSVRVLKGASRPVQCEADRAEILASIGCVDYVTYFSESTPEKLIEFLQPNILVKGGDWAIDKILGSDFVLSRGGVVKSLPFHQGRSTSAIIEKVMKTT